MFFKSEKRYNLLMEGEGPDVEQKPSHTFLQSCKRPIIIAILLGWVLLTAYLAVWTFIIPTHSQSRISSCGNTSTSARQQGCSFDMISFSWQAPECYNEALVSEFMAWNNWTFYTEMRGNVTVPTEVAIQGEQGLWVSWEYHLVHCTFVWRQMQIGYERGWIDSHVRSYPHTLHCQKMLFLEGLEPDDYMIYAVVQFPTCEKFGPETKWEDLSPELRRMGNHSGHHHMTNSRQNEGR